MATQSDSTSNSSVSLNPNWTYVAALVDCSGSMQSLNPHNTSSQLQSLIREQKASDDERVDVSVARFSDSGTYRLFIENKPAQDVTITTDDVRPGGCTALLESMARIINDTGVTLRDMTTERPGKVVLIIFTDGEENASSGEYHGEDGRKRVAEMVKHQQDVYNWKFYFLGANIDAITVGKSLGIGANTCINYTPSQMGCTNVMTSASAAVKRFRSSQQPYDDGFTQAERNASMTLPTDNTVNTFPVGISLPVSTSGVFVSQAMPHLSPLQRSSKRDLNPTFDNISEE
jgi:hypothetical protein